MKNSNKNMKGLFSYLAAAFGVIGLAMIPETSGAIDLSLSAGFSFGGTDSSGGIADSLCTIVGWFIYGGVGAAIASMAVIFMGIAAFFGKVTWGMALVTAASIFAIFGAQEIVQAIVPSGLGAVTSCGGGSGISIGIGI